MSNSFYVASLAPATGSQGSSAVMRAEFAAIEGGFDLLPTLSSVPYHIVHVNAGSSALTTTSGFSFDGSTMSVPGVIVGTGGMSFGGNITLGAYYISYDGTNAGLSFDASNNATLSANLTVTGNLSVNGNTTIGNATGDGFTINPSAWTLANAVTITGTWADLGSVTTVDINGGTIDGVTIGGASAGAGTFTSLNATGGGSLTGTWSDLGTVTTVDINGGTIDGATIGASSRAAGNFTTLDANGNVVLGDAATDTLTFNAKAANSLRFANNYGITLDNSVGSASNGIKRNGSDILEIGDTGFNNEVYIQTGASNIRLMPNGYTGLLVAYEAGVITNFLTVAPATASNSPYLYWNGSDTNISGRYITKGTGSHWFYGAGGGTFYAIIQGAGGSEVNYLLLQAASTGNQVYVYPGSTTDTNVPLGLSSRGNSYVNIYSEGAAVQIMTLYGASTTQQSVGIGNSAPTSSTNHTILHIGRGDTTTYNAEATILLQTGNAAGGARTWEIRSDVNDYTFTVMDGSASGYGIKIRYSDGSGAAGALYPITDSLADLGVAGSIAWRTLYVDRLHVGGLTQLDYIQHRIIGNFTSGGADTYAFQFQVSGTLTGASGDTSYLGGTLFNAAVTTQGASQTVSVVTQAYFSEPLITVGTGDSITWAATVYIANAPTEGTNNAALFVGGLTYFNGQIQVGLGSASTGVKTVSYSLGTKSSGTVTPNPEDCPLQHYTNGGAHTLAPSGNAGSMIVDITNNGSAGAITTSGFTQTSGDSFTTTNGHKFRCSITIGNAGSLLAVTALQ